MSWTGGDWMCAACQHQNFRKREACQRCGYPKYGGPDVSTYLYNRTEALAGDWYCVAMNCGAHNYASRPNCYRCGTMKTDYGGYTVMGSESSAPPGWKTGDWMCTSNDNRKFQQVVNSHHSVHLNDDDDDMPDLSSECDCNFVLTDMGVEFTITLAGLNASNARHQGILVRKILV
ncbi:hypothetical protein Godav_007753 [Gossypium davidsonii]|uniref:RanBP2-type domain-containing protein n=2 Tax=Gossypium TaxID=3633 RepID=A0A7J8S8M7_GOSDV|nr:hypothetical protein [Gossypium davidsonii]MBA0657675.1 hypothetical protein [Gossypium klotzschianum]